MSPPEAPADLDGIAIVGMAGRFPGAEDLERFWQNLRDGVDGIRRFSDQELLAAGVRPELLADPRYVKAAGVLDGIELFDAPFFGFSPAEAELMDPQQRLFLECAWEALESAGYNPEGCQVPVGVYAGVGMNNYLLHNLGRGGLAAEPLAGIQGTIGNDKDFLTTRVSYKLNLRGPSVNVQSACSTALVAVAMACQSLTDYQCDVALAGGVSIGNLPRSGYLYQEGGTLSPDGRCRAFDAEARGMVGGDGVGVVVLKRLADAVADGDPLRAVLRGWAVNNDGGVKAGYTAPSVQGQAEVIALAMALGGIDPDSITYVEAHGTGTPLGDPIEIAALNRAFGAGVGIGRRQRCAVGSVKTNVGHLDVAAGVAGLIKTVLALEHRQLPASLHYERPNPRIDFAAGPFYVNSALAEWRSEDGPRRAGVSSFGIGGTNAHVVVEEAPPAAPAAAPSRPWQLLVLSARTPEALAAASERLAAHLEGDPLDNGVKSAETTQPAPATLADIAHTLRVGRKTFEHRRIVVARDRREAAAALAGRERRRSFTAAVTAGGSGEPPVVFLFPGVGTQHGGMGEELYRCEPVFRSHLDGCAEIVAPILGLDLRALLYPGLYPGLADVEEASRRLTAPLLAMPALFATEYALARLWMSWGIRPQAMVGHSLGEYVAACLAGVLSLADALELVCLRGRLLATLPAGAMLSVSLPPAAAVELGGAEMSLAAVNGPTRSVLSGEAAAIAALAERCERGGIEARVLAIDMAGHSARVEPILPEFAAAVRRVELRPPELPMLSNVTGSWLSAAEATDPEHWVRHLRRTVRFGEALRELGREPGRLLLEVGPGQSLCTLARLQGTPAEGAGFRAILPSMRHPRDPQSDEACLLQTLGKLWALGAAVDWQGFAGDERRRRVPLPAYPFERRRYWLEPRGLEPRLEPRSSAPPAGGLRIPVQKLLDGLASAPAEDEAVAALRRLLSGAADGDRRHVRHVIVAVEDDPASDPSPVPQLQSAARHSRPDLSTPYAVAASAAEQELAALWQELLGIAAVGVDDDFFEMGGHSLLAGRLLTRMRQELGVELPLRSLFEHPTIAELARHVESLRDGAGSPSERPPLVPVARDGELPLSFPQQRLWFLDQWQGGSSNYNVPAAVRLEGILDVQALARGLTEIVRRHEVLRTTFTAIKGRPRQEIRPPAALPLPLTDLTDLPPAPREGETEHLAREEARAPFDLGRGPLLRVRLLRCGAEDHVLLLTMHHIAADGGSTAVLVRELLALYGAFAAGKPSPLPELAVQYADFAVWQRRLLDGPDGPNGPNGIDGLGGELAERQLAYWRQRLAGAPALDLSTDRPRRRAQRFRGARKGFVLPAAERQRLEALGRAEGSTLLMTLLAAFEILLQHESAQDDVVVGLDVAQRDHPELEALIGFFVNQVVLRVDLAGAVDFNAVLGRVRRALLEAHENRDLPFERLVAELSPGRDLSRTPLFQVKVAFQREPPAPAALPDLAVTALDLPVDETRFDLTLFLLDTGEEVRGALEYDTDLFDAATISRLAERLRELLLRVAAQPDVRSSELLDLLAAGDRERRAREGERLAAVGLQRLASLRRQAPEVALPTP